MCEAFAGEKNLKYIAAKPQDWVAKGYKPFAGERPERNSPSRVSFPVNSNKFALPQREGGNLTATNIYHNSKAPLYDHSTFTPLGLPDKIISLFNRQNNSCTVKIVSQNIYSSTILHAQNCKKSVNILPYSTLMHLIHP